jgi:UDP-N-acetylglucosamine 2-epimerase (non-hydrolysing)
MVILGTRPEAIKLAPVVLEMQNRGHGLVPYVCVTGQHRQMLDQILEWFRIAPDCDLDLMQHNQDLPEFAARALTALSGILRMVKTDAILVQGDTTTAMIAALAGFYQRIPVAHLEAGLRTFDLDNPFPEEMNRRVAGILATYHFAPTKRAAQALLDENVNPKHVTVAGNTVIDALRITMGRNVELPPECCVSNGRKLVLVTAHRRESFGASFESICQGICAIANRHTDIEIVYPVHLNPNVRGPVARYLTGHPRIRLLEPLRYEQFVHLMARCHLILTDSGGIQEEATMLGKPTLIMRNTTERPEAVAAGTAKLVGTNAKTIASSVDLLLSDTGTYRAMSQPNCPFGDGYAAQKILRVLRSHLLAEPALPFAPAA